MIDAETIKTLETIENPYALKDERKYSLRLYTDQIKITRYKPIKTRYTYYNERYKYDKLSNALLPWTYEDALRREKNYIASLRRARRKINEISDYNAFLYFLTVTFPRTVVNAEDAGEVERTWKNLTKRLRYYYGSFEFLSAPEFHKDEKGIHIHAMCNFGREPKLQYRGRTPKGHAYYHFHKSERFKRSDVFLTVEKLTNGNNPYYLTKYITKGHIQPFTRRYSCSRGLKRPILCDIVRMDTCPYFDSLAASEGFTTIYKDRDMASYEVKTDARSAAGLVYKDTKGEKNLTTPEELADFFYEFVAKLKNAERIRSKVLDMKAKTPVSRKTEYEQTSFFNA